MLVSELLARGRSAQNKGIKYKMGGGGRHPEDELPSRDGSLDCSGYQCWVLGISRAPSKEFPDWVSTFSIYHDAMTKRVLFHKIPKAEVGCFAVYPPVKGKAGHIALVTDPAKHTILDCSSSQNGIAEHDGGYFWRNPATIFVWANKVVKDQ